MDIEKAKEKYSDSISSGNTGLMGTYLQNPDDEVKNYVIQIGNLVANEELQIETSLIQQIDSEDLSYKYRFLKSSLPKVTYNEISSKYQIKSQESTFKFNAKIISNSRLTRLISKSHKLLYAFSSDCKTCNISVYDHQKANIDIEILFRNSNTSIPKLYEEYNPQLKQYTYNFNMMFDERGNNNNITQNKHIVDTEPSINYYQKYENTACTL